ncbi:MAG: DUF4159 domain-containing protein [Elusimicrobia bacterium]|nr:DUF4159 domain-containing protein [Elusimicrobiota bacterium]
MRLLRLSNVFALLWAVFGFGIRPQAGASQPSDPASGNEFVYAQLRHSGDWDPYPTVWNQIAATLAQTTSVSPLPERRVLTAEDPGLFESPFLVLMGRGRVVLSEEGKRNLRHYLSGGGFLLIDNSEAEKGGPFARTVLAALSGLFPDAAWRSVPPDHAVFRAFFLLRGVSGRRIAEPDLKGLWVQDRLTAVYCANDLQGAWVRDPLGNPLFTCEPGGEVQRQESVKGMINILMFSLTGTYKTDAIHQPFIEQKLRQ